MDVSKCLLALFAPDADKIHLHRQYALVRTVTAATRARSLAITDLGRALANPTTDKHRIKAADRLVGNPHLERERHLGYRAMARQLIPVGSRPVLLVDWSPIDDGIRHVLLRAALATRDGRAVPVCEQVFPARKQQQPASHALFLDRLAEILPEGCVPLLVTDAGFHHDWWTQVDLRGWGFLCRIRGTIHVQTRRDGCWNDLPTLYARAGRQVRDLGAVRLTRRHRSVARVCLVKGPRRQRVRRTRLGTRGRRTHDKEQERTWRDPWLLATNLPADQLPADAMVRQYARRMQIEEAFRDTKNTRFGLGLSAPRATSLVRLHNRLLLAALATWCLWVAGLAVRDTGRERLLQSNTREAPAYSVPALGRLLVRQPRDWIRITARDLRRAVAALPGRCFTDLAADR